MMRMKVIKRKEDCPDREREREERNEGVVKRWWWWWLEDKRREGASEGEKCVRFDQMSKRGSGYICVFLRSRLRGVPYSDGGRSLFKIHSKSEKCQHA
jgi:hypothetical protein